jgi:hypothetical protein
MVVVKLGANSHLAEPCYLHSKNNEYTIRGRVLEIISINSTSNVWSVQIGLVGISQRGIQLLTVPKVDIIYTGQLNFAVGDYIQMCKVIQQINSDIPRATRAHTARIIST